ncbi:hypothetical protein DERP_002635 [Dermatophagoides pteronyssinus]|uniref:Uncharacterized protein n=1 Tax=Dermatophagoides pteronyssinus TaxID=6956 RepID=A0ABQ8JW58_DERPT|nr:hypothetical protein DERP_002635 [Dermatophagoides pteronyssinus]
MCLIRFLSRKSDSTTVFARSILRSLLSNDCYFIEARQFASRNSEDLLEVNCGKLLIVTSNLMSISWN